MANCSFCGGYVAPESFQNLTLCLDVHDWKKSVKLTACGFCAKDVEECGVVTEECYDKFTERETMA